jgi:hypothetical protein
MVAVFRNLLHAHVHHRSSARATTFWAGCGAIRRDRFLALGGFDESQRMLEDVEIGIRLHEAGGTLALDPRIQVTHHKEWTIRSMLRSDVLDRAVPWTRMLLERGLPHDLNFRWQDRWSTVLAVLLPVLFFWGLRFGRVWWGLAVAATLAMLALQWPLFRFLARARGWWFSLASVPLYVVHLLASGAGLAIGLWKWETSRDRRFGLAVGALAVLIFGGIQLAGGAHTAEFDGYPDEAAHFMTGLMLRDFLVQWPLHHPISWAEQYYLHYPKVALGHWPPLFHGIEAIWWLFVPPSRPSAMLLLGLIGLTAAAAFYHLARELAHRVVAFLAACLLVVSPVFQDSVSLVMADILTLLVGVLLVGTLAQFCRQRTRAAFLAAGALCLACLMIKGTGVCLIPALFLAPLILGYATVLRRRYLWASVVLLAAAGLGWYLMFNPSLATIGKWAGAGLGNQHNIGSVGQLAGYGAVALAVAGFFLTLPQRQPMAIASAAVLFSIVGSSFFLGAMNEPRHWIMALPPLLLLSLACLRAVWELRSAFRVPATVLAAGLLLALFPWQWHRQKPVGYQKIAPVIRYPARLMVAGSNGWEEGSWIVMGSLREPRPSSLFVRATKVLSRSGWTGDHYRLLATTPVAVEAILDRFGIETVVLDAHQERAHVFPDFALLRETVSQNPVWRQCARSGGLSVYQRRTPLQRIPDRLRIDLGFSIGRVITEHRPAEDGN